MNVETLNKCLRDELSAVETYRQALDKIRASYGEDPKFQQLAGMLQDHQEAASRVRTLILQIGGAETDDAGAWGAWSKAVMGTAELFGDKAALEALMEGEESGVKDYREAIDDAAIPADVKGALNTLMAAQERHVRDLDRMMQAA
jgi:rubrerythrin